MSSKKNSNSKGAKGDQDQPNTTNNNNNGDQNDAPADESNSRSIWNIYKFGRSSNKSSHSSLSQDRRKSYDHIFDESTTSSINSLSNTNSGSDLRISTTNLNNHNHFNSSKLSYQSNQSTRTNPITVSSNNNNSNNDQNGNNNGDRSGGLNSAPTTRDGIPLTTPSGISQHHTLGSPRTGGHHHHPSGVSSRSKKLVRPERSRSRLPSRSRLRQGRPGALPGTGPDDDADSIVDRGWSCQWWTWTSRCLTCWVCSCCLTKCGGMHDPLMQQAWREKMALCLIIFVSCIALGFLTFGMTTIVCRPKPFVYKHAEVAKMNTTNQRWFMIHGYIYNIPDKYLPYPHSDLSINPYTTFAGKDITVFFPFNPTCRASGYRYQFDCAYPGMPAIEHCHDTDVMSTLDKVGQVNWDWEEIEGSNHLLAYNGMVLDIGYYLDQISPKMRMKPFGDKVDDIFRKYVGADATKAMTSIDKNTIRCLLESFGAGTLDVKSVGCIFTDIVLYVSLVAILAVVLVKFFLAVIFTCFMSKKLGEFEARKKMLKKPRLMPSSVPSAMDELDPLFSSQASMQKKYEQYESTESRSRRLSGFSQESAGGDVEAGRRFSQSNGSSGPFDMSVSRGRQLAGSRSQTWNVASPKQRISSRYATAMQRNLPPRHSLSFSHFPSMTKSGYASDFNLPVLSDSKMVDGDGKENMPLTSRPHISAIKLDSQIDPDVMYTILVVTCYSEEESGLRSTIESLVETDYPDDQKLLFIVADGLITGSGNVKSTPEILIDMMEVDQYAGTVHGKVWSKITNPYGFGPAGRKFNSQPHSMPSTPLKKTEYEDQNIPKGKYLSTSADPFHVSPGPGEENWMPEAYSYVAIADGTKRHNMARVFAGHFSSKSHRVPAILVVKCGTPVEAVLPKPGNRGKRDSQIILMSFLSKVLFDDRMTPLEYDMYIKMRYLMNGVTPDQFEAVLCVDADTIVVPDCLTHMTAVLKMDPLIMGLCGETKIANKAASWVTAMQVFEYFISHHLNKAFESIFGGVTCLPGCFCMYRIKAPKGPMGYWAPILASPDIVDLYSENVTDTLHKRNLLLLGEDRYLTTLMLKTFTKRKLVFVPKAACKTQVPDKFKILLSQRRRWINSTVHNLFELVLVSDLCGTFCCSMQFVIFMELVGTLVLPAAILFTGVLIISSFVGDVQYIPLALLFAILGLPAFLILLTARSYVYLGYLFVYLLSLPIWNFVLPVYAYWHFDDFSWGETRKVANTDPKESHGSAEGIFDSSQIHMRRWHEFEADYMKKLAMEAGNNDQENGGDTNDTDGGGDLYSSSNEHRVGSSTNINIIS